MSSDRSPPASPPRRSSNAGAAGAAPPQLSPETPHTPLLRGEHAPAYSDQAAPAEPAESPSVLSRRRGGGAGAGAGATAPLGEDPLFAGLSRGLSDASAEAARGTAAQQQRRVRVGEGGGSSNEQSDADDDDLSSRPHISSEHKLDAPATGLASPLISPHGHAASPGLGGAPRRATDSVLRRHIRLVHGDFAMAPVEREFALSQKSWFTRTFTTPTVDRTDLFRDNVIRSSRYTLWNFLPLNLWEQLTPWNKPANFYFLCIAFLQCITEISTTGGRPSILVPLVFVLTVTAIKDALEDYARHKQDRIKNQATYTVWRNGAWMRILSKNLLVGDLVRVKDGQRIPADLLLVSSGISNGTHAFVDTKELDGESNLKPKQVALPFLAVAKKEWRNLSGLTIDLKTDVPNQVMSAWSGDVVVNSRRDNVSLTNFMLTDSVLRNSHWIVGLLVYTGEDQKIRMNMARELSSTRQKESSVFKLTKKLFMAMVVVQLVACFAAAFDAGKHQDENRKHNAWYLMPTQTPLYFAFLRFFTWFIIVKDFIPISLYVSLEMVQFWQAIFIGWDKKMTVVRDGEEIPATAQSSKLNEQLAQVEYVFSDKTGTLTCNSMVFRKCIIDGETFGTGTTEAGRLRRRKLEHSERRRRRREHLKSEGFNAREIAAAEEKAAEEDDDESLVASSDQAEFAAPESEDELRLPHVEFNQAQRIAEELKGLPTLSQRLLGSSSSSSSSSVSAKPSRAEMIQIFMYALALNNSVFPQPKRLEDDDEDGNGQRKPSAAVSPGAAKVQRQRLERQLSMSSGSGGVVRVNLADEEAEERARAEADHSMDPGDEVILESSSPDERALVDFAQAMGYELIKRSAGRVELRSRQVDVQQLLKQSKDMQQEHLTASPQPPSSAAPRTLDPSSYVIEPFEELCMLDFTSKRKRMTVLLRLLNPDGSASSKVLVLIKGADSALKPYLTKTSSAQWDETYNKLGEMGSESLRTLLLGFAIQDYSWWNSQLKTEYQDAQRHQGASEKGHVEGECSPECRLCAAENAIEASAGFQILGASALEDLLAPQVPETLEKMLLAGMKVWMLTGDQLTTAQNIAISCNLLDAEMSNEGRLFTFDRNLDTPDAIDATLRKCTRRMDKLMAQHHAEGFGAVPVFGLCVHGDVFKTLQEEHAHYRKQAKLASGAASPPSANSASSASAASQGSLLHRFFDLASKCRSVIACRLEPKEKSDIVRLMKKRTGAVTMAVGDGNNDTPMIKAADIGVGIRGVEGTSAVSSSDYAIASFRFLQRLLFVHGRLNYRRISTLILYVFYKSSFLVWTLFLFGMYSEFSGSYMYLDWAVQLHNVAYTAFPILVFATFDRDLEMDTLEKFPHIYALTRGPVLFNARIFARWMILAFVQGCICFFVPFLAFDVLTSPDPSGQSYGLWASGMVVYVCVVLTTNLKLLWVFSSWTVWHHVSLWGSIVIFASAMAMFSSSPKFAIGGADYYWVAFKLVALARFWSVVFVTVSACVVCDLAVTSALRMFFTSPTQKMIDVERHYRSQPRVLKAVAVALAKEIAEKEQERMLSMHSGALPDKPEAAAGSSTWDDVGGSAESRRRALLSRRSKQPRQDEAAAEQKDVSESPDVEAGLGAAREQSWTGFAYTFTPRGTYDSQPQINESWVPAATKTIAEDQHDH